MASVPKKAKVVGQVSNDEFLVEKILDKRHEDGVWKYNIKWVGWPDDTNTWEPLDNLNGCEKLLATFEKKWALDNPELAAAIEPDNHGDPEESDESELSESDYDSDEDEQDARSKARKFMDYDVMEECPPDKEASQMIGVIDLNGRLTYLVEWKKDQENVTEDDVVDRSLILSTVFQLKYPEIVIHFYENHISFAQKPMSGDNIAELAARALADARDRRVDDGIEDEVAEQADNPELGVDIPTESSMHIEIDLADLDSSSDSIQSGDVEAEADEYEIDQDV